MKVVRFIQRWRGHAEGSEAELTDERAAELLRTGYCEDPDAPAPKPGRRRKAEPPPEPEPEPAEQAE